MLNRVLTPLTEPVYAALRIVVGLLFMFHGMQKVLGVLAEFQPPAGSQLWIGGAIELVTGLLIAIGLFTSDDKAQLAVDMIGQEDHCGDMDFKVAGTRDGITGFQVDLKLKGLSWDLVEQAFAKAKRENKPRVSIMRRT